jgi:hypothetical protein
VQHNIEIVACTTGACNQDEARLKQTAASLILFFVSVTVIPAWFAGLDWMTGLGVFLHYKTVLIVS